MTSRFSLRMFGDRISRLVSSFSLVLALAASCLAQGRYGSLDEKLEGVNDPATVEQLTREAAQQDPRLREYTNQLSRDDPNTRAAAAKRVKEYVELKARVERTATGSKEDPREIARRIKRSPVYRDKGPGESSNWLAQALEKLRGMFDWDQPDTPDLPRGPVGFWGGPVLTYIVWGLIIAGVLAFAYFAFRHFSWKAKLKRKATALLGEDEPERSLDEWLGMADDLEREGKYREAVRCLYLACLLKFDENHVARFERAETNWEHLARIEVSPRRPAQLSFREPTQLFDQVWYGHHVRGAEDVQAFRAWYSEIVNAFREPAAA